MAGRGWISQRSIRIVDNDRPVGEDAAGRCAHERRTMARIEIRLPDDLAERARSAGLLSDSAIRELLEDAMRRQAGRRLMAVAQQLHEAGIPPMSDEAVVKEVEAVRIERRKRRDKAKASRQA
jgi:hypothetical protein